MANCLYCNQKDITIKYIHREGYEVYCIKCEPKGYFVSLDYLAGTYNYKLKAKQWIK